MTAAAGITDVIISGAVRPRVMRICHHKARLVIDERASCVRITLKVLSIGNRKRTKGANRRWVATLECKIHCVKGGLQTTTRENVQNSAILRVFSMIVYPNQSTGDAIYFSLFIIYLFIFILHLAIFSAYFCSANVYSL